MSEPVKTDKSKELRYYHVIAPEEETTSRGKRSNEYNVREVCIEKGYNIIGCMFLGNVKNVPLNSIDILDMPEKEEDDKPKKSFKKPFNKKR